ncbi:MAG: hypothetical protein ACRDJN_21200, partial [Chloroflexota bacterium]
MPSAQFGQGRLGQRATRRIAGAAAAAAVIGGLLLGAATAESPTAYVASEAATPPAATPPGATPSAIPGGQGGAGVRAPRQPLHRLLAAWLRGGTARRANQGMRLLVGRFVRVTQDGALLRVARGEERLV